MKIKIKIYVQSVYYELWRIISSSHKTLTTKVEGKYVPKPEFTWDKIDLKILQLNAKARNVFLLCTRPKWI